MSSNVGFSNLMWFMGIVEENNDPQKLGRVKVRAFGTHPESKVDVPTGDLPWAYVISGTYNSAYKPPEVNSWVFGFFLDGKAAQQPMLLGSLLGMPGMIPNVDPTKGFVSSGNGDGQSNLEKQTQTVFEPDLSRLARGEYLHQTSVFLKNTMAEKSFPGSTYNASYPHNYVHETSSGHVLELDDTPGYERVHLYHKSGSSVEMDSRGNVIHKTTGDDFVSIDRNSHVHISGDYDVDVSGEIRLKGGNDVNLTVDGDLNTTVHGNYNLNVAGEYNVNIAGSIKTRGSDIRNEASTGNITLDSKGITQIRSSGDTIFQSDSNMNISSKGGDFSIQSSGAMNILSGSRLSMDASGNIYIDNGSNPAQEAEVANVELGQTSMIEPPKPKTPIRVSRRSFAPTRHTLQDDTFVDGDSGNTVDTSDLSPVGDILGMDKAKSVAESYLGSSITQSEWNILVRGTIAESTSNPVEQANVMAVMLNRVISPLYPNSITEVLYQPNQFQAVTGTAANGNQPASNFTREYSESELDALSDAIIEYLPEANNSWLNFTAANPDAYGAGTDVGFLEEVKNSPGSQQIGGTYFGTVS